MNKDPNPLPRFRLCLAFVAAACGAPQRCLRRVVRLIQLRDESRPRPPHTIGRSRTRFPYAFATCAGLLAAPSLPAVPIVATTLLFCGLSAQSVKASIYWVDAANGSDSSPGTSPGALAYKTTNAIPPLGPSDTVYLSGDLRDNTTITGGVGGGAATLLISGLSDVTIAAMPGYPPPVFRGDRQLVRSGYTANGSAFQRTIPIAGTPDAVAWGWDQNIDVNGHHFGHLIPDTAANCITPPDSKGRYNVTGTTLTVYLGGENPNTSSKYVSLCYVPTSQEAALKFVNSPRGYAYGITFALYPSQGGTGQTGWGIIFMSSPNSVGSACTAHDMGAHPFGSYASGSTSSGCVFIGCHANSGRAGGGGSFIHFTTSAFPLSATNSQCSADLYPYLGTDGVALAAGTGSISSVSVANPTQVTSAGHGLKTGDVVTIAGTNTTGSTVGTFRVTVVDSSNFTVAVNVTAVTSGSGTWAASLDAYSGCPFLAHADTGTPVQSIYNSLCQVHYYQDPGNNFQAFNANNTSAPATPSSWFSFPCRCDQCAVIGSNQEYYTSGNVSFRRTSIKQTYQLPEGGGGTRGAVTLWTGAVDGYLLYEACVFICDFSDTAAGGNVTRGFSCNSNSGNSYITIINSSGLDLSAQTASNFHAWFDYLSVDANLFRVYGSAFGFTTVGGATALCIADTGTSVANHTFIDGAYEKVGTGRYSQSASLSSQALWSLNADAGGTFVSTPMFTNAPANLTLTPSSSLWSVRRTTSAVVPAFGIDGLYRAFKGASQPSPVIYKTDTYGMIQPPGQFGPVHRPWHRRCCA